MANFIRTCPDPGYKIHSFQAPDSCSFIMFVCCDFTVILIN